MAEFIAQVRIDTKVDIDQASYARIINEALQIKLGQQVYETALANN
jgi:hypothetical protein